MEQTRIAVTGIGVYSAIGNNKKEFWNGLIEGKSGAGAISTFDTTDYKSKIAAEIKGFAPQEFLSRKRIRRMSRFSQLASCAAIQAVQESEIQLDTMDPLRTGAVVGTAAGDYENLEAQHQKLLEKGPGFGNPLAVPMIIPNMSSANIGIDLGLTGPNIGITTACASGGHAIAMAAMILKTGGADVMFAGGAEAAISPITVNAYGCMGVLTSRNEAPQRASRPFDAERDGFLIGEGAAVLVLETEAHARARGAKILGYIAGAGMTSDAYSIAIPEPDGKNAAAAMKMAVHSGGLNYEDIGYINAHGTSTRANDKIETIAIKNAFGEAASRIPISSTKSMIGHTLGAAGAVEAVATLLALKEGVLPPTINYENPDPECDLDYLPNQPREASIKGALSNSFGFGGQNCVLAFTGPNT